MSRLFRKVNFEQARKGASKPCSDSAAPRYVLPVLMERGINTEYALSASKISEEKAFK